MYEHNAGTAEERAQNHAENVGSPCNGACDLS